MRILADDGSHILHLVDILHAPIATRETNSLHIVYICCHMSEQTNEIYGPGICFWGDATMCNSVVLYNETFFARDKCIWYIRKTT